MNRIEATGLTKIPLGRQGENLARQIVFDVSAWEDEYGIGVAELIFQRSRSEAPYPVKTERDGNKVIWSVTASDTYTPGDNGKCELRYYVDKVLVKSCIWKVGVDRAMDTPSGTAPPYPERGWVDQVVAAGAEAKQAADRAENAVVHAPIIGDNGNWFVWDSTITEYIDTGRYSGGSAPYIGANGNWFIGTEDSGVSATGPAGPAGRDGVDGKDGAPGKDGTSATHSWNGTALTITSASGTSSADLKGEKGDSGVYYGSSEPGETYDIWIDPDGSGIEIPTTEEVQTMIEESTSGFLTDIDITAEQTSTGATITIGSKSVTLENGTDGRNGTDGKDGKDGTDGYTPIKGKDYFDGKDGYTPVKGVDYYTDEEKSEMVQAVIAALPTAEGGAY